MIQEGWGNCRGIVTEASGKDSVCTWKGWTQLEASVRLTLEGKGRIQGYRSRLSATLEVTNLPSFLLIASFFLRDKEAQNEQWGRGIRVLRRIKLLKNHVRKQ